MYITTMIKLKTIIPLFLVAFLGNATVFSQDSIQIANAQGAQGVTTLDAIVDEKAQTTAPAPQTLPTPSKQEAPADTGNKQLDTAAVNLLEGVDILGSNTIATMYVLWDNFEFLDNTVKEQIEMRNFARDEFLMQNIDREEFEQERILLLFEDRKKQYFNLFGENIDELIEEEESQ